MSKSREARPPQSTNRTSTSPSAPDPPGPVRRSRRGRWLVLGLAGVAFAAAGRTYWLTPLLNHQADRAIAAQQPKAALNWLSWADRLAARTAQTGLTEARAYRKLGDMERVDGALSAARKAGATNRQIQREQILAMAQSGQMRQAEPELPRLLTATEGDPEDVCEAFVIGFARNQRFGQAMKLLDVWISDYPESAQAFFMRSKIHTALKATLKAEADLRRATELDASRKDAVLELAEILRVTNRPEDAIPLFESCRKVPDLEVRAMIGLAQCSKSTGKVDEAVSLLQGAVERAPENLTARKELGRIESENGRYPEAVEQLEFAAERSPQDDELRYLLAQALSLAGRKEEAAPHFRYVEEARSALSEMNVLNDRLNKDPNDLEALVRTGELLMKYADPEEASLRLMAVLDSDPDNAKALELLADHYGRRAKSDPRFQPLADRFRRQRAAAP
jgi:tetratricopeptide (TPR) repeat protein